MEAYLIHLLILIGIYAILALSLNLAMGYTGLLNVGHVAFYGIGAYTSALLTLRLDWPFLLAIIAAAVVAGTTALIIASPTLRLKGDYLALATIGLAIILETVLRNWTSLTRGPLGLPGIPKPEFLSLTINDAFAYLILVIIIAAISYWLLFKVIRAPFGRILKAIREDEMVVKILGKNTFAFKTSSLVISAMFAGIAGSLFAHYLTFIDPTSFNLVEALLIISMVVVGGSASVKGSLLGAAVLLLLPEPLRFIAIPTHILGPLRQIIYGILLVLIIIKKPKGLLPEKK